MKRKLNVYLYHEFVGELIQDPSGQMFFTYAQNWLDNPQAILLSHSLPLRKKTFTRKECRGFFSGVLPESTNREILSGILGISPRNDFALLESIGGECAGAVTFLPEGQTPEMATNQYRELSNAQLVHILKILPNKPLLGGDAGIRLSLAGAQDKLAVHVDGKKISIPLKNSLSTHILKPAINRFDGLVSNEYFCLQLAGQLGLPVAESSIHKIGKTQYLLVKRYDRLRDQSGNLYRLHQEDFCQALGIVSEMKYQNEGGPSLKQCFDLLRALSSRPALDLKTLFEAVIFNYLIGNNDAHGKNFSLVYRDHQIELAPLYDLVCTIYYPELSQKMAMKLGRTYKSGEVRRGDLDQWALNIGFSTPVTRKLILEMVEKMIGTIKKTEVTDSLSKKIRGLILKRCERTQLLF